jgi:hypothetical protein
MARYSQPRTHRRLRCPTCGDATRVVRTDPLSDSATIRERYCEGCDQIYVSRTHERWVQPADLSPRRELAHA